MVIWKIVFYNLASIIGSALPCLDTLAGKHDAQDQIKRLLVYDCSSQVNCKFHNNKFSSFPYFSDAPWVERDVHSHGVDCLRRSSAQAKYERRASMEYLRKGWVFLFPDSRMTSAAPSSS